MTAIAREQQRLIALAKSGLSGLTSIGAFETAAHEIVAGMSTAIGAIGSIDSDSITYQGVALAPYASRSFLTKERNFPRRLLPCGFLLEQDKTICISDLAADPEFATCPAIQEFGIRAYLGVPLRNASGDCLGTIEAIDLAPRHFTRRDIQFLELISRNLALELERAPSLDFLASDRPQPTIAIHYPEADETVTSGRGGFDRLRSNLVDRLVQDLRTPLTSVLGMTSVLNQEIYGALRPKQKEYLGIVHDSGQQMLSMVDSLIALQDLQEALSVTSTNIEVLCQQLINRLGAQAERRACRLDISFNLEEASWPLDRVKVDLALFHLLTRLLDASDEGCTVRLHAHTIEGFLRFEVWVKHPWLGDSLPLSDLVLLGLDSDDVTADLATPETLIRTASPIELDLRSHLEASSGSDRNHLNLLLSCYLFEQHHGRVVVTGCERSGYRYVLDVPHESV